MIENFFEVKVERGHPQQRIVDEVLQSRTIMLLGATDVGKTTLAMMLAQTFYEKGINVGLVDSDPGQSTIGPPTTIGLAMTSGMKDSKLNLHTESLYFVGSTTPRGAFLPTVIGTKMLVDKAFSSGVEKVFIDTSGLVKGSLGRILKLYKIELVRPDLILCLQRRDECEEILSGYRHRSSPKIVRISPSPLARVRNWEERSEYRTRRFREYFQQAVEVAIEPRTLNLFNFPIFTGVSLSRQNTPLLWLEKLSIDLAVVTHEPLEDAALRTLEESFRGYQIKNYTPSDFRGNLVGLLDKGMETIGVGMIREINFERPMIRLTLPPSLPQVAGLKFSEYKLKL